MVHGCRLPYFKELSMKKMIVWGAALAFVSLGCDDLKPKDPIDEKYHGEWTFAELASGETNPTALGCEKHNLVHSRKRELLVEKDKITLKYHYYVLNDICDSSSTFDFKTSIRVDDIDPKDDKTVLNGTSFSSSLSLGNTATATYFIAQNICNHSTWQTVLSYYDTEDSIKGCTTSNDGGFGFTVPSEDQVKNTILRLQFQGDGIAYATKTKDQGDGEFENGQLYFLKK